MSKAVCLADFREKHLLFSFLYTFLCPSTNNLLVNVAKHMFFCVNYFTFYFVLRGNFTLNLLIFFVFSVRFLLMAETEDGEENKGRSKWSCTLCTYNNIAGQLKCDLCSTPRFGSDNGNDAVKRQAKILSQKWSCSVCTYDNIESAHQCTKCDNVRPSESDMNAPEDHAEITECSPNENFPSEVACYLNSGKITFSCSCYFRSILYL